MAVSSIEQAQASELAKAPRSWLTATRYSLIELARNRFAMGLLFVFVPLWYYLLGALIDNTPIAFKYSATGALLEVNSHNIVLLTAGLNAITLVVGFLMFAQTRTGAAFDRRLILCGYRQWELMLAKLTAMLITSALVALYATLALLLFWKPVSLPLVWVGFFAASLIYGAFGLMIGALVTSEVAGFFLIIMISMFDTFFQNPVENPLANKPVLQYFPSYGPTQIMVGGGFVHNYTGYGLLSALFWLVGLALLGIFFFWIRTRSWNAGHHARATSA